MSFASEKDMHIWLRGRMGDVDGLGELIVNLGMLEPKAGDSPQTRVIRDSFHYSASVLTLTEVIVDDEDISLSEDDVLKPDFVLYALEDQALVIVELKNLVSPSRQAGTEASAYAGELRSHLPFLSDGDVINVLVSSVWPTLLCHYVAHEIQWIGRKMLCLEPVQKPDGTHDLKIIDPERFSDQVDLKVSTYEMGGYQLCLYDHGLYGGGDRARLDPHVEQMRTTLQMMAARGNALRSHGFGFLWKDHLPISLAPYSITMVQAAPFQGVAKTLLKLGEGESLRPIQEKFIKLVREYDPAGHSRALSELLTVAKRSLDSICSPTMEGFLDWEALDGIMAGRAELIAFAGWGRFGDEMAERLTAAFEAGNASHAHDDPKLGRQVIQDLLTSERPVLPTDIDLSDEYEDEDFDDDAPM